MTVGEKGEWSWVSSENNAADRASRLNSTPADLALGSAWLEGPAHLKLPVQDWPMNRDFADRKSKLKVPVDEVKRKIRYQVEIGSAKLNVFPGGPGSLDNFILEKFDHGMCTNSWDKLVRSTSFLFKWYAKMTCFGDQSVDMVAVVDMVAKEMAVTFWMRVAMPATNRAAASGKLKQLTLMLHPKYSDMLVDTS